MILVRRKERSLATYLATKGFGESFGPYAVKNAYDWTKRSFMVKKVVLLIMTLLPIVVLIRMSVFGVGVAFDFMTEETKSWLVRGRMSTARVWKREDAAPLFPLAPDGRIYQGSRSIGYDASIRLSGVAQLSPRVQAGLAFGRGISPQFGDKLVMLELRILLEPRRGVVSADLPAVRGE